MSVLCSPRVLFQLSRFNLQPAHPAAASHVVVVLVAVEAGCEGVAAINTISCVMGVNLDTLRPEPSVEGYSTQA
jgi:hypothetical protein